MERKTLALKINRGVKNAGEMGNDLVTLLTVTVIVITYTYYKEETNLYEFRSLPV